MSNTERTFIMIKPDGVQRGLVGEIIKRFEQKGFKLVAMKFMQASQSWVKSSRESRADPREVNGVITPPKGSEITVLTPVGLQMTDSFNICL